MPKLVVTLAVLLVLGFGGRTWYVNAQDRTTESGDEIAQASQNIVTLNTDQAAWSKLRDQDNSFEIKFPKNVFKRVSKQVISPLPNLEKLKSVGLAHSVVVKTCDQAVGCVSTTTDMAVDFFTVSRNFNDVFKDLQKRYGQNMPVVTVDDHQGVRFTVGTVTEGVVYTVLPVSNAKTLFIARSYLNEELDSKYKKTPEFIRYSDQKALFDQVISTLTFRPTL